RTPRRRAVLHPGVQGRRLRRRFRRRRAPGLRGPRRDLLRARPRLLPRDEPLGRPGGRDDDRRAAHDARRHEAAADAHQAAAVGRHRHARAGPGAARAHGLRRRAGRGRGGGGDGRVRARVRLPPEVRRRPHRRRPRGARPLRGADRVVAPLRPALVFIGFMAAGKSTAALEAAAALGESPADSDELLERELGTTIQEYFDRHGEPAFRAAEQRLVGALLDRADGGVIALGGGAVLSERTRAALRRHTVVLVDVDLETAWERAQGKGRPLARDRDAFARLFAQRAAIYEACADAIVPGTGDPHLVRRALPALRAAPAGLTLLWATSASGDYPV